MILEILTPEASERFYPDDFPEEEARSNRAVGALSAPFLRTLSDLADVLPPEQVVHVTTDWEGLPIVLLFGEPPEGWPWVGDIFYITSDGAIGEGGVNLPRYYDSVAAYMLNRLQRTADRLRTAVER